MEFFEFLGVNAKKLDYIVKTGDDVVTTRMQCDSQNFIVKCLANL
jgi:hypothetical protein